MQEVNNPPQENPALTNAYKLAQSKGYKKDINSFKSLISSDEAALNNIYNEVKTKGYKKDINSFKELVGVGSEKKNEVPTKPSTSTSVGPKLVSEQKTGSSGTKKQPEYEYKPIKDERGREVYEKVNGQLQPKMEKVLKGYASSTEERDIVREEVKQKFDKIEYNKKQALSNDPKLKTIEQDYQKTFEYPKEIEQKHLSDLEQEVNQTGFLNTAGQIATEYWNTSTGALFSEVNELFGGTPDYFKKKEYKPLQAEKKEAYQDLTQNSDKEPTPEEVTEKAKEIFLKKKKEDYIQSKQNKLLQNTSEEDLEKLSLRKRNHYKTLDSELVTINNQMVIISNRDKEFWREYDQFAKIIETENKKGTKNFSPEFVQRANELEQQKAIKLKEYKEIENKFNSKKADIGDVYEEFDDFKRTYSGGKVFLDKLAINTSTALLNLAALVPYAVNLADNAGLTNPAIDELNDITLKQINNAKESVDKLNDNYRKKIEEVYNVNDFIDYTSDVTTTQLPNMMPFLLGAPAGFAIIAAKGTGEKYSDMLKDELDLKFDGIESGRLYKTYKQQEKVIAPLVHASGDMLATIPTALRFMKGMGRVQRAIQQNPETRSLMQKTFWQKGKEALVREGGDLGKALASELPEEALAGIIQNGVNIALGDTDVTVLDGMEDILKDTATFTTILKVFPLVAGKMVRAITPKSDLQTLDNNAQEILNLNKRLNDPSLTETLRATIKTQIEQKIAESDAIIDGSVSNLSTNRAEKIKALTSIDNEILSLKQQAREVSESVLSKQEKNTLLKNLESRFNELQGKQQKILSKNASILDVVSEKESTKLKQQAAAELIKKAKSEGKTDEEINFTEEEVNKKAIELYNQSKPNATQQEAATTETQQETQQEAQPQTEAQEAEQEDLKPGTYELNGKTYIYDGSSLTNEEGDLYPLAFEEDGLLNELKNKGKLIDETNEDSLTKEQKIAQLEAELESITDDNNPRIAEIDAEIEALESEQQQITTNEVSNNQVDENNISDINKVGLYEKSDGTFNVRETNEDGTLKQILGRFKTKKEAQDYLDSLKKETPAENEVEQKPQITPKEKTKLRDKITKAKNVILRTGVFGKDGFFALPNEGVFGEAVNEIGDNDNVSAYTYPKDFKIKDLSDTVFDDYMANGMNEQAKKEGFDAVYVMEIDGSKVLHVLDTSKLSKFDDKLPDLNKNEAVQNPTTPTDGNVQPGVDNVAAVEPNNQENGKENIQPANDGGNVTTKKVTSKKVRNPKTGEFSSFDVDIDKDGFVSEIRNSKTGKVVEKFVEFTYKVKDKITGKEITKKGIKKNANWSIIESEALGIETENETNKNNRNILSNFTPTTAYQAALDFFARGGKVLLDSIQYERGNIDGKWATNQSNQEGLESIESVAENLADKYPNLDEKEIRNELIEVVAGFNNVQEVKDEIINANSENKRIEQQQELNTYLGSLSESELASLEYQMAEDAYLSELSENEILEYYEQQYGKEQERSQSETENGLDVRESNKEPKSDVEVSNETETKQRVRITYGPFTEEGVLLSNGDVLLDDGDVIVKNNIDAIEKIDQQPEAVEPNVEENDEFDNSDLEATPEEQPFSLDKKIEKDKLSDALDWLDGLKLDPNNLNATLPFLPQTWNMFIDAIKLAVKAGSTINDAIQEAIKKLQNEGIKNDEINAIVEKFTGQVTKKVESGTFERKEGKKSVLSRIYEGENSEQINESIEKFGLNYQVENQEEAQKRAKNFVKSVGINKALEAVRSNKIKGAEKAFVYAEILDQVVEASENASIEELAKIQNEYQTILDESLNAFDEEARDAGRFISALNRIYNNSKVRYNLSKQIEQYKAVNRGVIDEETLIKFNEADRKLKEAEEKIKEVEAKLKVQEQELAIKNIEEAIAREIKNKVSNKTKASKLASQIRKAKIHKPAIFSAATPASLVWDSAVELVAKSIETGGSIADAIQKGVEFIKNSDWYKNATKKTQNDAIESFIENMAEGSTDTSTSVTITDDGKFKIPESVIKDYVRNGITDINEISQRIIDDFFDGNENISIREVRDAITRYGKTINQSKDEINAKVRELKRLGKLMSAMEDVLNGKRPLKSGLQRDKPTQTEREMMRDLKDKMRDLPLDEADLKKAWKNALDTYKQRLKNQIEDLEKQIVNKEKSKIKRESVKLDEEAKALKEQVENLKETLNNLVGKPELTDEQKIARATSQLETAIDNITKQIANNELDYREKPTAVTSARLEELRKQKADLNKQLQKAREDAGIVEKRRLKQAKQRLKNQIELYQKKIQDKDFSKKESKPLPADIELQQLQAEKIKWQEVFDKAKYEAELRDRKWQDYAREVVVGIIGLPRILMAGGEMSMVFIQGGIQTISLAVRNPKLLAKTFAKAFVSVGSNKKFLEYEHAIKADPNYMLMKNSKLALTETDYKMELREESFIGSNIIYGLWNFIGKGIEYGSVKITGKKELPTIGSAFLSMIKKDISSNKIAISEQWKNINPLLAFERGNTIYMNELRKARFMDGVKKLKMEGKNENDNKEDFKTLAKAINTLTGRASVGRLENINDYLGVIFFSFKNTVSVFQQLNPLFYTYGLRNKSGDWNRPSAAQKIAVQDMMTFVTVTTSMLFLLQAAAGDDDDGKPKVKIETDPRSSDFMTLKVKGKNKDTRFDPWHGMKPQIVLFARLLTGEQKKLKNGKEEIKRIGLGYKADTHWDNITKAYVYNKFSPSMQMVYKEIDSEVDKEGNKTYFGETFEERFSLMPMYISSLREIEKEDPDGYTRFLAALGFFGLNSSTYGDKKQKKPTN